MALLTLCFVPTTAPARAPWVKHLVAVVVGMETFCFLMAKSLAAYSGVEGVMIKYRRR